MKLVSKSIILSFSFFISLTVFSQEKKETINPLETKDKKAKVKLDESQDHFMFNFTIDNMMDNGTNDSFYNANIFNPNIGAYFFYDLPLGKKSGISLAPGFGFTFSKVSLDNTLMFQDTSGSGFMDRNNSTFFNADRTYESSSFYNSWIEVPVELRYRSKPINGRSRIKVAVGMRGGLRLASSSKMTYIDDELGREVTQKTKTFTDVSPFRYGATFRIGYGAINLFGYYGLNQFFKDTKNANSLDLRQYSIGISITGQ